MSKSMGYHVAIIEDAAPVRRALVDLLESVAEVTVVASVAWLDPEPEILSALGIDLIILDLNLGHRSGLSMLEAMSGHRSPTIIVFSYGISDPVRTRCQFLGATAVIDKEAGAQALLSAVYAALER